MICTGFMVHIVYRTENENQSVDVEFLTAMIASDTCAILAHPRTLGHGTSRIVLLAAAFDSTRCLPKMKTPWPVAARAAEEKCRLHLSISIITCQHLSGGSTRGGVGPDAEGAPPGREEVVVLAQCSEQ